MQLLRNPALACSLETYLHPDLRAVLPVMWKLAEFSERHAWNKQPRTKEMQRALDWLDARQITDGVYVVPFLAPNVARAIQFEANDWPRCPNEAEEKAYRIPEIVLKEACPQLFRTTSELMQAGMWPVLQVVHGRTPSRINSIQLARYEPSGTRHGNWHHDEDSDQTIVVSLNSDAFEGGGTDIMTGPWSRLHVPKVPTGHALIFNGKMTLHRGCAVESGVRDLLVYWTEVK